MGRRGQFGDQRLDGLAQAGTPAGSLGYVEYGATGTGTGTSHYASPPPPPSQPSKNKMGWFSASKPCLGKAIHQMSGYESARALITQAIFRLRFRERRRRPTTLRVGPIDAAHADIPMCMALQTVDIRHDAAAVLDQIAAEDPSNTVSLIPERGTRNWRIQPQPGQTLLLPSCQDHADTLEDTLDCLARKRPAVPIAVWQCGSCTRIYCDHGLGDVRMIQKLAVLLTNPALTAEWFISRETRTTHPVLRALARAIRSQPRQLVRDLRAVAWRTLYAAHSKLAAEQHTAETSPASTPALGQSPLSVVFVNGSLVSDFRRHRDFHNRGVSLSAFLMHRAYTSFLAAGVSMPESVDVPIDCRRYLPPGVTTPANFQALIRVPILPGMSASEFAASLKQEIESFTPLLLLARWLLFIRLQSLGRVLRRRPSSGSAQPRASGTLNLTLVDNSRWLDDATITWRNPERSLFVGMVPPETEHHVVVVFSISGEGRLQATATFHPSQVDCEVVERSLAHTIVVP